jgi:hypothetical protein
VVADIVVGARFVTISGRLRCRTTLSSCTATPRAGEGDTVGRRGELGGLVDAGGLRRQPGRCAPLAVANGTLQQDAVNQVLLFLGFGAFMVVGALIVAHRPGNAIGWIFSTIALLAVSGQLAGQYAISASATRPGSLPAATVAPGTDVAVVSDHCPGADLHPAVVPDRSATLTALAAGRLAGWADHGGLQALTSLQTHLEVAPGQVVANPIGVAAAGHLENSPIPSP